MKTYREFCNEDFDRRRTKLVYSQRMGFRMKMINEDSWKKVLRGDEIQKGDVFGSSDGLVRVKEIMDKTRKDCYWCSVISPSHNEVSKNDIFSYSVDELFVGEDENPDNWNFEMLRDDITDQPKHKNVDKISTKVRVENINKMERI